MGRTKTSSSPPAPAPRRRHVPARPRGRPAATPQSRRSTPPERHATWLFRRTWTAARDTLFMSARWRAGGARAELRTWTERYTVQRRQPAGDRRRGRSSTRSADAVARVMFSTGTRDCRALRDRRGFSCVGGLTTAGPASRSKRARSLSLPLVGAQRACRGCGSGEQLALEQVARMVEGAVQLSHSTMRAAEEVGGERG